MMKKVLGLALAAVACAAWFASSELPELGEGGPDAATVGVAGFSSGRAGVSAARPQTFATLPDRGDLVSYPTPLPARVDGAYTWHRAELSEEHAFQSLQTGSLRITSPSGRPLEFEYSRHVEHPSGDWTWIGRLKGGAEADEAVITFGERAAFGAIAEPGRPNLRLTTSGGVAWLVETDPRKIATFDSEATRPTRPDYLIPPAQGTSAAASHPTPVAVAATPSPSAAVSAAAATTVDVVVGYTTGFAAMLGGQSQAVTRLNNMVEIANQAYRNSQIDAEVRMVHALQVNYPDNTSNSDALEKLTGYRSGSGQVPVDPAFAPLRAARDQYGGDLVTLVRRFQTPENNGCGIAWLLGGGQSGIDQGDAPFGYSVVGDSNGQLRPDTGTDGKSYFCRDETLAHELGHNMGSQHDRAAATENGQLQYGVFSYSFGYKSDLANGNFYTVMAYGDNGQLSYRVFSNPGITYCGSRVCGVVNQADNARSLRQTMPVVAAFRAGQVPGGAGTVRGDIDGDGVADILWRNRETGANAIWRSGNASTQQSVSSVATYWSVAGVGDFNGDGHSDILWRSAGGGNTIWLGGVSSSQQYVSSVSTYWVVAGVGDFDGDSRADILWRNGAGNNVIWRGGSSAAQMSVSSLGTQWSVEGVDDFDGDGRADILWRNTSGTNAIWRSANAATQQAISSVATYWSVAGTGDFDGDGRSDILWRSSGGNNTIWRSGVASAQQYVSSVSTYWSVAAVADFNGDGRADILWRNTGGNNTIWRSGNAGTQQYVSSLGTQWWVAND